MKKIGTGAPPALPAPSLRIPYNEGSGSTTTEIITNTTTDRGAGMYWGSDAFGVFAKWTAQDTNSYEHNINLPDIPDSNDFSVTMWIENNYDTLNGDPWGGVHRLLGSTAYATFSIYRDGLELGDAFIYQSDVGAKVVANTSMKSYNDILTHIAWVKEGTSFKFYVNNALHTSATIADDIISGTDLIHMGSRRYLSPNMKFYDFAVYGGHALTVDNINTLYDAKRSY